MVPLAQVDGPSHFSYNTWKVVGSTALKRRLLSRQGWTVIPIAFFEWDMVLPWKRPVRGAAYHMQGCPIHVVTVELPLFRTYVKPQHQSERL